MANVKFNRGKTRANSIAAAKTIGGYSTVYFPTDSATIVLGIGSTTDNREYGQAVQDVAGTERAFLLGHAAQGTIATTISNANVYMQEDKLYSNNSEVVNVADAQTISGDKTFAGKIIKSGGTGDQVLAADGSVRTIESAVTTGSDNLVTSGAVGVQIKAIDDRIAALEATGPSMNITWSELKALRDAGSLIPGMQYRITDYTCTTVTGGTKSAGHRFDIIVVADDESTLNETARVIKHEGDEYFANNDLNAWQIWYCLDNDTSRFDWADGTNGKGVIYRMIDEFNNDVPYDFKNIQFKHPKDTTTYPHYYYTFASKNVEDNTDYSLSITNNCYSNVIKEYISSDKRILNQIIFIGSDCSYNILGYNCINNTFGNNCQHNTFDDNCRYNTFGSQCSFNTFRNSCWYNILGSVCSNNILGSDCSYNTFGEACSYNTLGSSCWQIKFAADSPAETKYNFYKNNHFGDGCKYLLFKGAETASSSSQVQNYNFAQGIQGTSNVYLTIDGVRGLSYETKVEKDSRGKLKIFCLADMVIFEIPENDNPYSYPDST